MSTPDQHPAQGAAGDNRRPAPEIDAALVRRIAELARLELTDDECAAHAEQMARICGYMQRLQQLDLEGVAPLAHPLDAHIECRDDKPREGLPNEALMKMAPQSEQGFVKVPKVIGGGAEG